MRKIVWLPKQVVICPTGLATMAHCAWMLIKFVTKIMIVRTNLMRDFFARKIVVPVLKMSVLIFVTILHWDLCVIVHPGCIWMGQALVQKIILVTNGEHAHNYANLFSKMDRPKIDINVFAMKTTFWNRYCILLNVAYYDFYSLTLAITHHMKKKQ